MSRARQFWSIAVHVLWSLVDRMRPPWMRVCGTCFTASWVIACAAPGELVGRPPFTGMGILFDDTSWLIVNVLVWALCVCALVYEAHRGLRRICLLVLTSYYATTAFLVLFVGHTIESPMGVLNLMFAFLCGTAFLRPLLLNIFTEWERAAEESGSFLPISDPED